ncbi:MAG: TonB-dependent receptor [Halioglobus sp.]
MGHKIAKTAMAAALISLYTQHAAAQLEEVIVTAQKRSESMQDVPVAVTAIGGTDIEALGWDNPSDVAAQVPNMQMSAPFGDIQPLFSIRGVSMVDYTPSQSSPIGIYADEAYIGATFLHGMSMYDLERIEVLRGPQGTLYGKNTTGGAINLISRTPDIGTETNGFITAGAGSHGLISVVGALEGTLVDDTLSARLAYKYKKDDGVWENDNGPDMAQTKNYGLRLTLNYQPTDNLGIILKGSYGDSNPRATAARPEGTNPGGLNIAGSPESLNAKYHEGAIDSIGKAETEMSMLNLKVNYDFSDYTLVSVSSWYDGDYLQYSDTDGTPDPLASIYFGAETEALSQDLRLVSNYDGPFNFIAGLYYGDEDMDTNILHDNFFGSSVPNAVLPAQAAAVLLSNGTFGQIDRNLDVEKKSLAAYTDLNWDLSANWGLNAGLRYTEDETTRDYLNYSRINGGPLVLPPELTGAPFPITSDPRTEGSYIPGNTTGIDAPLVPPDVGFPVWTHGDLTTDSAPELSVTEREITGTIALNYTINDDVMVYGRYSHGYRSGAFNSGVVYLDEGDNAYAEPEFVDSYELGMKGEFIEGTVRLNAAAFYYDYQDQQFVNQVGISAILENAGGVDIYGLEFEALWLATDALTIQAGLGLIDAEYNELTLTGNDLKGNEPVSAPEVNFNIAADYEIDITNNWIARLHLDGNYIGDQWFSAYNGAVVETGDYSNIGQEAYWLWNARITASDAAERFAVSLWAANLTDEEYDVYAINLQGGFGFNYFMEGAPRSYGLELTYRF